MAKRSEEIKVGSLVVLSALLFLVTLMIVGGVNLLRRQQVNYVTHFKFAGGLDPGSVVRFAGRKVGTVQSADFDPHDTTLIVVRLKVLANTPVRTDSTAMISSLGFLGDNYVELPPAPRMRPCCLREARLLPRRWSRSLTSSITRTRSF